MLFGQLIVLRQLLILLLTAMGYGCWLWALTGRPSLRRNRMGVWLGLAGFCFHALLLQSFVYLGVPLQGTAWPAFLVGLAGLAFGLRQWRKDGGRGPTGEAKLYVLVFLGGFAGQAPGLFTLGPERYFGSAQYDQANYVVLAEFLRSEPFATREENIGNRPWLLRALEAKSGRITQSVVLGAVATVDGTDAQMAYGTVSLFFVALAGVATAAWLREAGLPRGAAGWAGLGAVLTPALTRINLDGFFSQNVTLFVFPALAGMLVRRGELDWGRKVCAALLLAFLIGSYTEVAPFGIALVVALVLVAGRPWRRRIFDLAFIVAGALALNPGYLGEVGSFLILQGGTMLTNPEALAALFPESGTWAGWGRLFADVPWRSGVIGAGILVAVFGAGGVAMQPAARRRRWLITLGVVLLPLAGLRAAPHFFGYAFAKLTMHFTPVWIGAAMAGIVCLTSGSPKRRRIGWAAGCVGTTMIFALTVPRHWAVMHPSSGRQILLASEALLQVRREVAANPQRARLVAEGDPLVALWLCYFGRASKVVLDRIMLGDRVVPSETYAFRRWTEPVGELWWLDAKKQGPVDDYEPPPALTVKGALESGYTSGIWRYYVVGEKIDFVFRRHADRTDVRVMWLDLAIEPLAWGEPGELVLEDSTHQTQRMTVRTSGWRRFQIAVPAGESLCHLELIPARAPTTGVGRAILWCVSVEVTPDRLPGISP